MWQGEMQTGSKSRIVASVLLLIFFFFFFFPTNTRHIRGGERTHTRDFNLHIKFHSCFYIYEAGVRSAAAAKSLRG